MNYTGENIYFLISSGRSGTTRIKRELKGTEGVNSILEKDHFENFRNVEGWDVWRNKNANLWVDPSGITPQAIHSTRKLYKKKYGTSTLVFDKGPTKVFRFKALRKVFPGASFVFHTRNTVEVARSIREKAKDGWFDTPTGKNLRWRQLRRYGKRVGVSLHGDPAPMYKAFAEATLGQSKIERLKREADPVRSVLTSYEQLVGDTVGFYSKLGRFMGVEINPNPTHYERKSPPVAVTVEPTQWQRNPS